MEATKEGSSGLSRTRQPRLCSLANVFGGGIAASSCKESSSAADESHSSHSQLLMVYFSLRAYLSASFCDSATNQWSVWSKHVRPPTIESDCAKSRRDLTARGEEILSEVKER